jgi:hypothetical protein
MFHPPGATFAVHPWLSAGFGVAQYEQSRAPIRYIIPSAYLAKIHHLSHIKTRGQPVQRPTIRDLPVAPAAKLAIRRE